MSTVIIAALPIAIAIIIFFVLVGIWYFVVVPAKRKSLTEEAR